MTLTLVALLNSHTNPPAYLCHAAPSNPSYLAHAPLTSHMFQTCHVFHQSPTYPTGLPHTSASHPYANDVKWYLSRIFFSNYMARMGWNMIKLLFERLSLID